MKEHAVHVTLVHRVAAIALSLAAVGRAEPFVSSFQAEQDPYSCCVTISYSLSERAVVTMAVETNRGDGVWIPIGDAMLTNAAGAVNRLVESNEPGRIFWTPIGTWPNRRIDGGNLRVGIKAWATNAPPDYMVIDLIHDSTIRYYPSAEAVPGGVTNRIYKTDFLVMRKIPAAGVEYWQGPVTNETGVQGNEYPRHRVAFTKDYYMAIYELTQQQYMTIRRNEGDIPNPSAFTGEGREVHPLENKNLSEFRGSTGGSMNDYSCIKTLRRSCGLPSIDIPTEARWEYACRAGEGTSLYDGHDITAAESDCPHLDRLAWNSFNSGSATHEVGTREPNAWGLYDMLGNVWEACIDIVDYTETPALDPDSPKYTSTSMMLRGGAYNQPPKSCRAARRLRDWTGWTTGVMGYRLSCDAMAIK